MCNKVPCFREKNIDFKNNHFSSLFYIYFFNWSMCLHTWKEAGILKASVHKKKANIVTTMLPRSTLWGVPFCKSTLKKKEYSGEKVYSRQIYHLLRG